MANVRVTGLAEILEKLRRIEDPRRNKRILRSVWQAGATVLKKNMKAVVKSNVTQRTGSLLNSIDTKVKIYRSGNIIALVGPRRGARATYYSLNGKVIKPNLYFHLVDQGTKPHLQPNAHRLINVNGRPILVPVGPQRHPGARAANVRNKTTARSTQTVPAAMAKRANKLVIAEATRG